MTAQSNVPEWAAVQTPSGERHLPVYLLLDTSGSMGGAPIQSVREGLEQFQREVAEDPFAREEGGRDHLLQRCATGHGWTGTDLRLSTTPPGCLGSDAPGPGL
jgi:hypothetical protein